MKYEYEFLSAVIKVQYFYYIVYNDAIKLGATNAENKSGVYN